MDKPAVAITECTEYDFNSVKSALEKIIAVTDFPDCRDKYILVKPNVLSDAPVEKHITTNPIVVKALISILKEKGAGKIIVGDSPGLPGANFKAKTCGIYDVCVEEWVEWVDFSDTPTPHTLSNGIKVVQTHYLEDVDLVFSVAKMKTHQLMGATGCVKNMFGTVPGLNKSPMHLKAPSPLAFARVILDIFSTHIPEYSVMDGIISMEGAGPANGTPRQTSLLLGSSSAIALDCAEAVIMGYNPKDIPILFVAEREKKGVTDAIYPLIKPADIVIKDFRRVPVKKRSLFSALILPYLQRHSERKSTHSRPAPLFNHEKCRRCLKCVEICPAGALKLEDSKVTIAREKCIRCYCCHEMCPFDAIIVKKDD